MPSIQSCRLVDVQMGYAIQGDSDVTLKYHIRTDTSVDSVADFQTILSQSFSATPSPVPTLYTHLGGGAYVLRHQITPRSEHATTKLTLTVSAGKLPDGQSPGFATPEQIEDPTKRKIIWWNERISETRIVDRDKNGGPILNAAGQPFDEPIVEEDWLTVIVAQRNYGTLEEIEQINEQFKDSVNSSTFRGHTNGTVRFTGIETGPPQYENGIEYYQGQTRFIVKISGWTKRIVNKGFKHFTEDANPANRVLVNATENGQPVSEPVLLTEDGRRLPKDQVGNFIAVEIYEEMDYGPLATDPT